VALLFPGPAQAGSVAGYTEYFIPGPEEQLWAIIDDISDDAGGNINIALGMHCVISITATGDETTVYYDHWEDGYDFDPDNPDATADRKDILQAGEVKEYVGGSIPVNPRGAAVYYDGGDRIYVAGATVAVSRSAWTESEGTVISLCFTLLPVKPFLTDYTIPIGEDLAWNSPFYTDFEHAYVIVQSTTDNNLVTIDDPTLAGVEVTATLNTGQATRLDRINAGTHIHADQPVQVQFIVGSITRNLYEMRGFTAFPDSLWDNEYYNAVPGANNGDTDLYIYNPNPYPIIIEYEDTSGSGQFLVGARTTLSYSDGAGRYVPVNSGVYLYSDDIFWGIGSSDAESITYEWGYSLVPANVLTDDYHLTWAPGTSQVPPANNGSPAYVTVTQDETVVFVDFSPTDGVIDQTYTLDRLEAQKIFDPDNNNTGMHIFSTSPIVVTWGQDPDRAGTSVPYLDLGSTILPMDRDWLDLTLAIDKTVDPSVVAPVAGKVSTVSLTITTYEFPVLNISVSDLLPAGWSYVADSTVIQLPDNSLILGTAANPSIAGQNITWSNATLGGLNMRTGETLNLTFGIVTDATVTQGMIAVNTARARGERLEGSQVFSPWDNAIMQVTSLVVDKDAATPYAQSGGTADYTITARNISDTPVTDVDFSDTLPTGFTFNSNLSITLTNGTRTWTDNPSAGDTTPYWGGWDLQAGGGVTIVFRVNAGAAVAPGVYDNTLEAYSTQTGDINDIGTAAQDLGTPGNEDPENDEDITVTALTIDKDTGTPEVLAPGNARYTITLRNSSATQVTGVTAQDYLQPGFTYAGTVSITAESATRTSTTNPTAGTGTPLWGTWTIQSGGSVAITFDVAVAATVAEGTYDNGALAQSAETGPVDDSGAVAQDLDTPPGLDPETDEDITVRHWMTIDKDALVAVSDPAYPTAVYRVVVRNTGTLPLTGVTVSDTLVGGMPLASTDTIVETGASRTGFLTPAAGASSLTWGTWTISPGGALSIAFTVSTVGVAAGTYDNTASAASTETGAIDDNGIIAQDAGTPPGEDPETDEDIRVYSQPTADIYTIKSHIGNFQSGVDALYWIEVYNAGPSTITENLVTHPITVTDVLPAGMTFVSASATGWTVNTAALPAITFTNPCVGGFRPGTGLPIIELVVRPGAAAVSSVTNSVTVTAPVAYADPDTGNNSFSDPTVVIGPDLSAPVKDVGDVNGGDVNPGDTLMYTVTVVESGGVAVSGVTLSDDMPANTNTPQAVSCPPGATCQMLAGGANGTGRLSVTGISVPAYGQTDVVFSLRVDTPLAAGTAINNSAAITNPAGPGGTATAPTVYVQDSQLPGAGTKPLYLSQSPTLVRTPPAAPQNYVQINENASTNWPLTPVAQRAIVIERDQGVIPVYLLMTRAGDTTTNRNVRVTLSAAGAVTQTIGTYTWNFTGALTTVVQLFTANLAITPATDITIPAGSWLNVNVALLESGTGTRQIRVYPLDTVSGLRSFTEMQFNTVINVDSVGFYTAAYAGGTLVAQANVANTVYVRAVAGDPFGSADITSATLDVVDANGDTVVSGAAMPMVNDSGAATKTYEYALNIPSNGPVGFWTATVRAKEGTENQVTHTGIASLEVLPAPGVDLAVFKAHTGAFSVNQTAQYAISVSNSGTATQTSQVTVTDTFPAGVSYVSGSAPGWTVNETGVPTVTWTYPVSAGSPLGPGESLPPITVTVTVLDAAFPSVSNTATVNTGTGETNTGNNSSTDTAQVTRLTVDKTSDGVDPLYPGDTVTYTVTVANTGLAEATGVVVKDPLAPGTTHVANSTSVTAPVQAFRVTEYYIPVATFTGTTYDLTLNQDLSPNYFVIIQGTPNRSGNEGPDVTYASLIQDPFGTGDLNVSSGPRVVRLQRNGSNQNWTGVVTVVECADSAATGTKGFRLLDVQRTSHGLNVTSGTDTSAIGWTSLNQVLLMAGANGAGINSADTSQNNMSCCHLRYWPSGTGTINWSRSATLNRAASTSTVMVLEWGSEWTVQRRNVTGSAGGAGVDATTGYNTSAISSVVRDNTWVWGTGFTDTQGTGRQLEGAVITLGNGVAQNTNETLVAVGLHYALAKDFDVYALTHSGLAVDYRFKANGDSDLTSYDVTVDTALSPSQSMALSYNSGANDGNNYPTPDFSARYAANTSVRLQRVRTGENFAAWVQGIDFTNIFTTKTQPGDAPLDLVSASDAYSLLPGRSMTVTYQITVNNPPETGSVTNTVYAVSGEFVDPATDSVTHVVRSIPTANFTDASGNPVTPGGEFSIYEEHDTIHLKVFDPDHNENPDLIESITVTVTSPDGDSETVTLYETGPDTGIFANNSLRYLFELPLDSETSVPGDGRLYVTPNNTENISLSYTDPLGDVVVDLDSVAALVATRAVIASFGAFAEAGRLVVCWETVSENRTLGFYLERFDTGAQTWTRVNARPVPGFHSAPQGGWYRLVDPDAPLQGESVYRLVELEAGGRRPVYGPFTVTPGERPDGVPDSAEAFASAPHPARADSPAPEEAAPAASEKGMQTLDTEPGTRIRIQVARPGLHRILAADAAPLLGLTTEAFRSLLAANGIALTNKGADVPWFPTEDYASLFFIGENPESNYTTENIYWLAPGQGRLLPREMTGDVDGSGTPGVGDAVAVLRLAAGMGPQEGSRPAWAGDATGDGAADTLDALWILQAAAELRTAPVQNGPAPASAPSVFPYTRHFEEEHEALTDYHDDPDADFWAWVTLLAGVPESDTLTATVDAPGLASGPGAASIEVALKGISATAAEDHHVRVRVNGTVAGDATLDGMASRTASFDFDASLLAETGNIVTVTALLDTGAEYSYVAVDSFDLTWPRQTLAENGQLVMDGLEDPVVTVGGFDSAGLAVFDLSTPGLPVRLGGTTVDSQAGKWRLSFEPGVYARRYLAADMANPFAPAGMSAAGDPPDLLSAANAAQWLVIAPRAFADAAAPLAAHRAGQGLSSMVVTVEDVMDVFNHGNYDPAAIRAFLAHARSTWTTPPLYVLLAGDGSYDYKELLGCGGNHVPAIMAGTPEGLFASDSLYGDVEGDDRIPEIAVGRLPVSSAAELLALADKIISYEARDSAPWQQRVVLAADQPQAGSNFPGDSDAAGALFPSKYQKNKIYLSNRTVENAREALIGAWQEGAVFVNYMGHGGFGQFADEGFLVNSDVPGLTPAAGLPVVGAYTCNVGRFEIPGVDFLSEDLTVTPQGGAIAMWSTAGLSLHVRARTLSEELVKSVFVLGRARLGDALLEALVNYRGRTGDTLMPSIYNLFGDPALRFPKDLRPPGVPY
jgi:uncharacterized repeat protein (TIGR01451 family)